MSDAKDPAIKIFGKTIQLPSASDSTQVDEHVESPPEHIGEEQESNKVQLHSSFQIIKPLIS